MEGDFYDVPFHLVHAVNKNGTVLSYDKLISLQNLSTEEIKDSLEISIQLTKEELTKYKIENSKKTFLN